jgi:hypothetical protein
MKRGVQWICHRRPFLFVGGRFVVGRFVVGRFVVGRFVVGRFVVGRFVVGRFVVGRFVVRLLVLCLLVPGLLVPGLLVPGLLPVRFFTGAFVCFFGRFPGARRSSEVVARGLDLADFAVLRRDFGFFDPVAAERSCATSLSVSFRCVPTGWSPSFKGPIATRRRRTTLFPIRASKRRISRLRPSFKMISNSV